MLNCGVTGAMACRAVQNGIRFIVVSEIECVFSIFSFFWPALIDINLKDKKKKIQLCKKEVIMTIIVCSMGEKKDDKMRDKE